MRPTPEQAALLQNLTRQIPGAIYQYLLTPGKPPSVPWASEGMRDLYELEPEVLREDASITTTRIHLDDRERVRASIEASRQSLQPWREEYRVILPIRGLRWLRADARPERLPDGSTLWHGYISDVTERALEQQALKESEERFRVQIEHAPEAIVVYDVDRDRIIDVNSNAERLFGYSRAELLQRSILDIHPARQSNGAASSGGAEALVARALAGEALVFEWDHRDSSGRAFPCEVRLVRLPAEGRALVRGSVTDISTRNKAAEDLVRLETAIASSINGVAIAGLDGRITYVNKALLDLWGYTDASQVLGTLATEYWVNELTPAQLFVTLKETGAWSGEMSARRVDGSVRLFQVNASAFTDEAGTLVGMLASFADITDARRTEEALRLRDQAIQAAITAIAVSDPQGRPVYVNPAFVRLFGYDSADEVLGRTLTDFVTADAPTLAETMEALFVGGAWQGEFIGRRRDGSTLDVMAATNLVRDASGEVTHLMGSFLDITEANRLANELQQAQKMESVGRLAGGIAHDFNNLLTVMQGSLDLVRERIGRESALDDELAQIGRAAASAADLTRQLLAFSRKQIIAPRTLDLNVVVRQVHGMLQRVLGEDVRVELLLSDDLGRVRFDPGQAEQILLNLAVNARDAMPDGGRLSIETSNLTLDASYSRLHAKVEAGEYVLLVVSDTGVGMSEATRTHAFEPFFTTKGVGQGTGLGLAMIHGAVSQNGGRVEVYSELGHGSSFKIYLPRVRDAVAEPASDAAVSGARDALPRGTETVVLVEDDDSVRSLLRRLLERQGYRVHCFAGGEPLLEWLDTPHEPIHLLLTDVIMPGMNGKMIAERVQARYPDVRVLYASGYTANVIVQHGVLKPGVEFLSKPFTLATLAQTVRTLLDQR
ncbi:MAG: PAS domain S-box protein [Gemmatimonadota bacterium]